MVTSQLPCLLNSGILDNSVWCLHHNSLRYLHKNSLGRESCANQQHHLYDWLSFDFETPLKLKLAMMITGGSPLLTKLLRVILIPLPRSTEQSTLAQSPVHFPTELPSVLQDLWYPACLLDLEVFRLQDAEWFSNPLHFIPLSGFILRTIGRPSFSQSVETDC